MISFDKNQLQRIAGEYGFVRDTFEKVLRLSKVLKIIDGDPLLREHLVLKGGTAINLAIQDLPRLSVDIDMDFVPNYSKEKMLVCREEIKSRLQGIMASDGYVFLSTTRTSLSLDSMRFGYSTAGGGTDSIKIEINYSLRAHVNECIRQIISFPFLQKDVEVAMVDPVEIYAAKINALLNRAAPRDLFDINAMVDRNLIDADKQDQLRKCVVFYACICEDIPDVAFNTARVAELTYSRMRKELFPVLRGTNLAGFDLNKRIESAQNYISGLMSLTDNEKEFMKQFSERNYVPKLLFHDPEVVSRIQQHPMALWKCSSSKEN